MSASTSPIFGTDLKIISGGKPELNDSLYVEARNVWFNPTASGRAIKLAEGEPLSFGNGMSPYATLEFMGVGSWNSPNDGVGYLGIFNFDQAQAWVKINYNDAANTLQLLAFGYNSDGAILAGQTSAIPEPASAAAMAALLAGGVAAFGRRQKRAA